MEFTRKKILYYGNALLALSMVVGLNWFMETGIRLYSLRRSAPVLEAYQIPFSYLGVVVALAYACRSRQRMKTHQTLLNRASAAFLGPAERPTTKLTSHHRVPLTSLTDQLTSEPKEGEPPPL